MAGRPETIDDYLAAVSDEQRTALQKLRKTIRAAAPKAEECMSYGLPAFHQDGALVAYGAAATHCALYPMSPAVIAAHQDDLGDYDTSKGTIRFQPEQPLPVALVRKLVKARLAENAVARRMSKPRGRAKPRVTGSEVTTAQTDPAVIAFLRELDHPLKEDVEVVRRMILDVSPEIREGIKWNAPSFRTVDYFATVNLRARDSVQLILHMGAKTKDSATKGVDIADPKGLLKWLAKDRCLMTLGSGKELRANKKAMQAILRQWTDCAQETRVVASPKAKRATVVTRKKATKPASAIVVPDASKEPRVLDDRIRALGIQLTSVMVAPVEVSGRYLGLIELVNPADGRAFTEGDGHALTYIGEQYAEFVAERGVVLDPESVIERHQKR